MKMKMKNVPSFGEKYDNDDDDEFLHSVWPKYAYAGPSLRVKESRKDASKATRCERLIIPCLFLGVTHGPQHAKRFILAYPPVPPPTSIPPIIYFRIFVSLFKNHLF